MPGFSRRQGLLRAAGLLAGWPGWAGAQALVEAAAPCLRAIAQLRQGRLLDVDPPAEESGRGRDCSAASSNSPAVFQAASLSKPMVATLALQLVLRGALDLDKPVGDTLPDGYPHRQNLFALREPPVVDAVPRDVLKKITPRHLLSHTSGLPNWAERGPLQLAQEPGTGWRYSGEGYVLLQHLLQAVTGLPLNDLASAALFEPWGLRNTAFKLTGAVEPWLVPGHTAAGQVRQLRFPQEIAAGSLYTSAPDYARFIAATLADRHLLDLITCDPVPVPDARGVHWGLGWGIERQRDGMVLWHWGANPGFRALAMAELASKDAVVVLTATEGGMPQAKAIVREALPGAHPGLELKFVQ